ncbi:MAG: hypothetical protein ACYSW3_00085 [Planctomycetota bacterium]|jgi:hypothetical protein
MSKEIKEKLLAIEMPVIEDITLIKVLEIKNKHVEQMDNINPRIDQPVPKGEILGYSNPWIIMRLNSGRLGKLRDVDLVEKLVTDYCQEHKEDLDQSNWTEVSSAARKEALRYIHSLPQIFRG